MADTEHEHQMAEEEILSKDHPVGPLDVLTSFLEETVEDEVGGDLTNFGRTELPFEAEQLAVRLMRAAERAQGAEVQGVKEHVRSLLRAVGAPLRAKRVAELVQAFLRGMDAGRL